MTNKLLVFSLASLLSLTLHAKEGKNGPCQKIKIACEAAGFKKGEHKNDNKGLHLDCMKPILDGQTVASVSVRAEDVAACNVKKSEHKAKKDARK